MRINTEQTRQLLGCGWAPIPPERLRPFVSVPTPLLYQPLRDDNGEPLPRECPGYVTRLPEVVEIARAKFWKDDLHSFCGGDLPTEALMLGIEVLQAAQNEFDSARMTPSDKGGIG